MTTCEQLPQIDVDRLSAGERRAADVFATFYYLLAFAGRKHYFINMACKLGAEDLFNLYAQRHALCVFFRSAEAKEWIKRAPFLRAARQFDYLRLVWSGSRLSSSRANFPAAQQSVSSGETTSAGVTRSPTTSFRQFNSLFVSSRRQRRRWQREQQQEKLNARAFGTRCLMTRQCVRARQGESRSLRSSCRLAAAAAATEAMTIRE